MTMRTMTVGLTVRDTGGDTPVMEVDVRVVPWDTATDLGAGLTERIQRGAIDPAAVVGLPLVWQHRDPIGRITAADGDGDALTATARISDTVLGRDARTLAADGVLGASIGFVPDQWYSGPDGTMVHTRIDLREISLTHNPAYQDTGVLAVRERSTTMTEQPITVTEVPHPWARDLGELRDMVAALQAAPTGPTGASPLMEHRSIAALATAVFNGEVSQRALADQVTGNNPGVIQPGWINDIKGIVDLGRPFIVGTGGPGGLPDSGMDVNWPSFSGDLSAIVAEQTAEKTEINSVRVDLVKGTTPIRTFAAGSDISYQLLMRSTPSYLDAYLRIVIAAWAAETEAAAVAAAVAAGTGSVTYAPGDPGSVHEAVVEASLDVFGATGQPPSIVAVRWDSWASVAGAVDPDGRPLYPAYNPTNSSGRATAPGALAIEIAGLPAVPVKSLTTVPFLVTNGAAFTWGESGPMTATAEDVSKLGRDMAVWGLAASQPYIPAGIVKITSA